MKKDNDKATQEDTNEVERKRTKGKEESFIYEMRDLETEKDNEKMDLDKEYFEENKNDKKDEIKNKINIDKEQRRITIIIDLEGLTDKDIIPVTTVNSITGLSTMDKEKINRKLNTISLEVAFNLQDKEKGMQKRCE